MEVLARGIFSAFLFLDEENVAVFFFLTGKFSSLLGVLARKTDFEDFLSSDRSTRVARLLDFLRAAKSSPRAAESTANERQNRDDVGDVFKPLASVGSRAVSRLRAERFGNVVKPCVFCLFSVSARRVVEVSPPTRSFARRPLDFRRS